MGNEFPDHFVLRMVNNDLRIELLRITGLLSAFLVSLAITIRIRWFWPNSLVAFLVAIVVYEYRDSIPDYLSLPFYISYFPLKLDSVWGFIITASIAQGLGLWLFFSRKTMRFIDTTAFFHREDVEVNS